jgi:hypothetical protein
MNKTALITGASGGLTVEKDKSIMISGRLYRWLDPLAQSVFIRPLVKAFAPGRSRK